MLRAIFLFALTMSSATFAREINTLEDFKKATAEACEGKNIGASCTIEFEGGSVTVGVCVEIPNSSPVGPIQLECRLNIPELGNCSTATSPESVLPIAGLLGMLFILRRKRR